MAVLKSLSGDPLHFKVILTLFLIAITRLSNAEDIQFNTDILDVKDRDNINISQFSRAGYLMPGNYSFAIRINNRDALPDESIDWLTPENDPKGSEPCLTPALVRQFNLKPEVFSHLHWVRGGQCLSIASLKGMEARGDLGSSTLYLSIPQAYLDYVAPNWDPPSLWDNGLGGILFDYYLNGQTRHTNGSKGSQYNSLSGNGTLGANAGSWRLRADWQARYDHTAESREHNQPSWDWSRYYAYRALPALRSKLTIGEDSFYSDIFDSFRFTGVSLLSDDNMLPPNLRGYAPEVTGVAKTNAKVVISQQGRVLEETQVAAGPFRIQDLSEMVSGELDVRVEEQDGSIQRFTVNTASVPYLTRPGSIRYKTALGRPSDRRHNYNGPLFASGEISVGVSNGWSVYGGGIGGESYSSLAAGIGRDLLAFGAISLDATQSRARLPHDGKTYSGSSWRVSYSKRFDETDSQVTFAGYRFSQRNFMSMSDYLDARTYRYRDGSNKEMYTITFNQQISSIGLSAYLNYSHQNYWDRPSDDRYALTMTRYFSLGSLRNMSLSATAYRNKYSGTKDDGMYLSLSVPWGSAGNVGYNGTFNRHDSMNQVTYYGRNGERDNYQLSAGATRGGETASGFWSHDGDIARVDANASYQAGRYTSMSLAAQGGITATMKGTALHRTNMIGGTRLMLDTDGVAGVPIKGFGANTTTNRFGIAVVADINSYYRNKVSIDLDALPDNADATRSIVQATLTEGAIGYRKFDVVSGGKAMAIIRFTDGTFPPFAAMIQNAKHQLVGIIEDNGSVYLSGIKPGERMTVFSGSDAICQLTLPSILQINTAQALLLPCPPIAKTEHSPK